MWNELGTAVQAYEYVTVFDALELERDRRLVDEEVTGVLEEEDMLGEEDKPGEEVVGK
jgi:hypothetical protein